MPQFRMPVDEEVDSSILGDSLSFPTTGRKAKNRIMKAALSEKISTYCPECPNKTGLPTQRLINTYAKFGHGGLGVILTGNVAVCPNHLEIAGNTVIAKEIDSPERRRQFAKLAAAAKADGALIIAQLSHAGRQTPSGVNAHPFSSSDVQLCGEVRGRNFGKPIALTTEQVKTEVVDRFVYAAKVAKLVGFDGVQLHGAHGYLLAQFLSRTTNKRTDQYGGSVENRVRVIQEIYEGIRKEIPAESGFVVGIKVNSVEFQGEGLQTNEAAEIARALDEAGFDFIELSGGTYEKLQFHHVRDSTKKREAFFLEFAQQVKPAIRRAVVYLTGGFRTVPGMVAAVKNGDTDGVGLGRPVAAEPDFAKKVLSGGIQSAAINHFESDFGVAVSAATTQMAQAGDTTMEEANGDPCYGVMDLSSEEESKKYKDALLPFVQKATEVALEGKAAYGIFEYNPQNVTVKVQA